MVNNMNRQQLREAIYQELFNELHRKDHEDPKGRGILKDKDDEENPKSEAINKSDAQYTMKMVFDNHGFGKALKKMKILRSGITLNMSSYMGPSKTLDKMVDEFNSIMGPKYKADKDSFQKGHITSIELKEGLNEDYSQRARNFRVALRRRLEKMKKGQKIKYGKQFWTAQGKNNFRDSLRTKTFTNGRLVPGQDVVQALKFAVQSDIMKHRGAAGDDMVNAYLKFEGKVNEGVPFPQTEPNELAYIDFKKWAYKNRKGLKKELSKYKDTRIFKRLVSIWEAWDKKANKGAFSNIKPNSNFGRKLAIMMKNDDVIFSKEAWKKNNKITNLKEASAIWKALDAKWKLQDEIIDLEDDMRDITKDLAQLHRDMEQEAEPEGGKIADRYGKEISKKEKEYKKKKAEFKKLMAKLDKMEMY